MENYIINEELRDVLTELADFFMGNPRYDVTISFSHFSSRDELGIQIQDRESSYKTVSNKTYTIIDGPSGAFDISKGIEEAIKEHEANKES
jgi:hypothetical protein